MLKIIKRYQTENKKVLQIKRDRKNWKKDEDEFWLSAGIVFRWTCNKQQTKNKQTNENKNKTNKRKQNKQTKTKTKQKTRSHINLDQFNLGLFWDVALQIRLKQITT